MAATQFIKTKDISANVGQIPGVNANPRTIKGEKFAKLKQSITDNPEMLELRELLVFEYQGKFVCIGGNMRYKACKELGLKEIPCKVIPPNTPAETLNAYIIKDNNGFGEWDWDALANEWAQEDLEAYGLDIPDVTEKEESRDTGKILAPVYEPRGEAPKLEDCVDYTKYRSLVEAIKSAKKLPSDVKEFLLMAAARHVVFNYEKIADYYAHAPKEVQALMEDSALVIIDFDKAIEGGFVQCTEWIKAMWDKDHGDGQEGGLDEE